MYIKQITVQPTLIDILLYYHIIQNTFKNATEIFDDHARYIYLLFRQ